MPNMNIERMELSGGAFFRGTPHVSGTKEYFHCVEGEMTINVSGEVHVVKKGDVLIFPGDSQHAYANKTKVNAIGISVVIMDL